VHHYSFQPFSGSIESFSPADLIGLTGVSEGWYIDYKAEAPSAKDLGRHLTAFANQHGGWLLIGIVENSATMTAGSFPGIANSQIPETLTKLRDASAHHSHPPLHFEHRIISGPVAELDLPQNRSLVVVGVPESQDTPHVHSSGKIYRRQADQSDPKEETDRHVLDRLWERRNQSRSALSKFLSSVPELSQAEDGQPRLFVYLLPRPLPLAIDMQLALSQFASVMTGQQEYLFSTSFNNVFLAADGYIARQTGSEDARSEGMTFRWFRDGAARLTLPIDILHPRPTSDSYPVYGEFLEACRSRGFEDRIADFSLCAVLLTALVGKCIKLRQSLGLASPFYAKAKLDDVWRMIPFVNMTSYVPHIRKWGIPLIQESRVFAPPGVTPESLIVLDPAATLINGDPRSAGLMTALPLASAILWAVGIGALEDPTNCKEFSGAMMQAASLLHRKSEAV
jgi:hypothetical protein